jgi:SHS2 domain-containing protein
MVFELFEHKADIGIKGIGETLEEAFSEGAKAMFSLMVELESVKAIKEVEVRVKADDVEALFVEWLNELLYLKDLKQMVFSEFKVKEIKKENSGFSLKGVVVGEEIDFEKHQLKIEVKAATYSQLRVWKENGKCFAQCVVDV